MLLGTAALYFFAIPQSDLVAYLIGGALVGITILAVLCNLLVRLSLGRSLRATPRFSAEIAVSGAAIPAGFTLTGASLPPLFTLTAVRRFAQPGVTCPAHVISGSDERRSLVDAVVFPHRGLWQLEGLTLWVADSLGLSRFRWFLESPFALEVSAPTLPILSLPVVAASSRSGDQLNQSQERSGDLFDIKAYDPSDGITRVLWKTYARSGQLVVRRPEPAVVPEGEVVIYLIANRTEDHVAGALQAYLAELERNNIIVLFGTDGMNSGIQAPSGFVTGPEIAKAINRSVWSERAGTGLDVAAFIGALQDTRRFIARVVVFGPERADGWFEHVAAVLASQHIAVTVALVPREVDPRVALQWKLNRGARSTIRSRLPWPTERRDVLSTNGRELAARMARSGAEVLLCRSAEQL